MKKFLILSLCIVYGFASSTLAHDFCVQQNQQAAQTHGCCDTGETPENCWQDCLSTVTNMIQPQHTSVKGVINPATIPQIIPYSYLLDDVFIYSTTYAPLDTTSDWCATHVGSTKKLE